MSATIYDSFQTVAAAWEINERLIYHTQPGGILAGLKYDAEGTFKVDGEDDLPLLQPWAFQLSDALHAGAPNTASRGLAQANQPLAETLTMTYRVATSRKNVWFRRDPTDTAAKKGLMEWVALIRDAIERPAADITSTEPDSRFGGGANKPVSFSISETNTTQQTFQCMLDVVVYVRPTCRGERSFTMPQP